MDSHISSFQISTFIRHTSVSETPDYTEANFDVKHTSKPEKLFVSSYFNSEEASKYFLHSTFTCQAEYILTR